MYLLLDNELLKKIESTTYTNYEAIGGFLPSDSIIPMLEDLLHEIDKLNEQLEDIKEDMRDNYEHIPYIKQIGMSEEDF